jgi:hypothetical protein
MESVPKGVIVNLRFELVEAPLEDFSLAFSFLDCDGTLAANFSSTKA